MKITKRKLKHLIEMAVRQDILDSAAQSPEKRTVLMKAALDVNKLDNIFQPTFGTAVKPVGLWYGFGTNWIDFVRNPDNKGLVDKYTTPEYFYNIDVKTVSISDSLTIGKTFPDAVLVLNDYDDLNVFQESFEVVRAGGMFLAEWLIISRKFGGLEVSDELAVYFGWDVASGCVWNKNAITKIQTLQTQETTENIPRGAAALGVTLDFNPSAQTIEDIGNQKLVDHLKEYEEDFEWKGYFDYEASEGEYSDYGENIYEKLANMVSAAEAGNDYGSWFSEALNKRRPRSDSYSSLGGAVWLLSHYNQNTNTVDGAVSVIYHINTDNNDLGDALDDTNSYLQKISELYGLGIKDIDLDYNDSWEYARRDIESSMDRY